MNTTQFAWWVFGYQIFSEDIIRRCIAFKTGWKDITKDVVTPTLEEILDALTKRKTWSQEFPELSRNARERIEGRSKRIVLDAAFQLDDRHAAIAEFKSWGGYQRWDPKLTVQQLPQGLLFPDRLAIPEVVLEGKHLPVTRFIVASNFSSAPGPSVMLGNLEVEMMDIGELLRDFGRKAAQEGGLYDQLDKAVKKVMAYVETGQMP